MLQQPTIESMADLMLCHAHETTRAWLNLVEMYDKKMVAPENRQYLENILYELYLGFLSWHKAVMLMICYSAFSLTKHQLSRLDGDLIAEATRLSAVKQTITTHALRALMDQNGFILVAHYLAGDDVSNLPEQDYHGLQRFTKLDLKNPYAKSLMHSYARALETVGKKWHDDELSNWMFYTMAWTYHEAIALDFFRDVEHALSTAMKREK